MRERLKNAREAKGLTQAEVAELVSIAPSYYGRIEREDIGLSAKMAKKLAVVLDTDSAWLLGKAGASQGAVSTPLTEEEYAQIAEFILRDHVDVHGPTLTDESIQTFGRTLAQYLIGLQQIDNREAIRKAMAGIRSRAKGRAATPAKSRNTKAA